MGKGIRTKKKKTIVYHLDKTFSVGATRSMRRSASMSFGRTPEMMEQKRLKARRVNRVKNKAAKLSRIANRSKK